MSMKAGRAALIRRGPWASIASPVRIGLGRNSRLLRAGQGGRILMDSSEIRPSRNYYTFAGVVVLLGVGLFAWTIWKGVGGIGGKLQQVAAPGKSDLTLAAPGSYTIFYEPESVFNNQVYSTGGKVSAIECTVVSKSTGAPVKLSHSTANATYSFGGRSGQSVFDFQIDRPGVYELTSNYPEGQQGPEIVLAVGHGVNEGMVVAVFGGLASLFGSFILGGAIVFITAVKRHNAYKRLQAQGGAPPPIE
jgi:hypothetical protein